jgi:hypothetical protein
MGRRAKSIVWTGSQAFWWTTVLFWSFHAMDRGVVVVSLASEWRLCVTCSLLAAGVVVGIFEMARLS